MVKRYNQQNFHIEMPNGETYSFYCYTTNTRNGFCHICYCSNNGKNSKVSYYNRTWESYDYQTVLYNAFDKLSKDVREICKAWDKIKVKEGQEKADAFVKNFEKLYKATSPEFKKRMKDITITNKSDANLVMTLAAMGCVMYDMINTLLTCPYELRHQTHLVTPLPSQKEALEFFDIDYENMNMNELLFSIQNALNSIK